jgi:hypothetical protein
MPDLGQSETSWPRAFYSEEHRCWYVPVASELFETADDRGPVEPVRVEIRDGQMWITRLEAS